MKIKYNTDWLNDHPQSFSYIFSIYTQTRPKLNCVQSVHPGHRLSLQTRVIFSRLCNYSISYVLFFYSLRAEWYLRIWDDPWIQAGSWGQKYPGSISARLDKCVFGILRYTIIYHNRVEMKRRKKMLSYNAWRCFPRSHTPLVFIYFQQT